MNPAMNKEGPSPMSGSVLWQLYRRLLGAELLRQRLPLGRRREASASAVAAALTENLLGGDTLGIPPGDLVTRYLLGMPLAPLHEAALLRRSRRLEGAWPLEDDREQGLLPGDGVEQAAHAVGTALASRLHGSGGITVLLERGTAARDAMTDTETWAPAVERAVALQLPLIFLASSSAAARTDRRRPAAILPAIPVDRSDALALYRVIYESAARARSGGGPTRIECCKWAIEGTARAEPAPGALEKMEQALKVRKLFNRQQQRHLRHALEKEFSAAGWPLAERD